MIHAWRKNSCLFKELIRRENMSVKFADSYLFGVHSSLT